MPAKLATSLRCASSLFVFLWIDRTFILVRDTALLMSHSFFHPVHNLNAVFLSSLGIPLARAIESPPAFPTWLSEAQSTPPFPFLLIPFCSRAC